MDNEFKEEERTLVSPFIYLTIYPMVRLFYYIVNS